ncbi:ketopantoate reductase family protein [Giesbergeria anulus]|uniref:2-dehydropantoate 2-reductase n=1 Tax=Giesbergeria anulus TaxID=180197 RepID=A0A1H9JB36_9BURK|nr:ketopantoate reductase family protein [Giesbergeria anulus]SEQ83939.1 ketopantoate reductase [Giesbergeria anulus]
MAALHIAVMGAGAVGCYYGALLARAGHSVTLIARPVHVQAIEQQQGLWLESAAFTGRVPVRAATDASAVKRVQFVLFCTKSTDTESAGKDMAAHLAPGAVVWSLQNGVDNAQRLAQVLGQPVVPVVVYVAAAMAAPGHVRHLGRGELLVGPHPSHAPLLAALAHAGVAVQESNDVRQALWAKLVLNCVYNPLSAVTDLSYGPLLASAGVEQVVRDIVQECLSVACASGITLPADTLDKVLQLAASMPQQKSSTAQDLARGKLSEIDHLNGFIVQEGTRLGISTPVNRLLHTLVRVRESYPFQAPA